MLSKNEILAIAKIESSDSEIRTLVDAQLANERSEATDFRVILTQDLLCDAAFEIFAQSVGPTKEKSVVLGDASTSMPLTETAIFNDLKRAHESGAVSLEEIRTLSLSSSLASAIANALKEGQCAEDICNSEFSIASVRFVSLFANQPKPKGLFARLTGFG